MANLNDSFADLWISSAPTKSTPPPQKLGSTTSSSQLNLGPKITQQDTFAVLSSAASSTPSSRPITPSSIPKPNLFPKTAPRLSGGDAFSNLFAGSIATPNIVSMTIAEKAALAKRQKMEHHLKQQDQARKQAAAWDGLESLDASGIHSASCVEDDGWPLGMSASSSSNSTPATYVSHPAGDAEWGLGDFASAPSSADTSLPIPSTQSIWDFDEFSTSPAIASIAPRSSHPIIPESSLLNSPGGIDFGDRADIASDGHSHNEDDILRVLNKPVDTTPERGVANLSNATPSPNLQAQSASRAAPPPPHIVGQIVEMGFSPQQARAALAATDTGLDVQAALEMLLANGVVSDSWDRERSQGHGLNSTQTDNEPLRRRKRSPLNRSTANHNIPGRQQERNVQLQEQADKLLAQASEIGFSMFNRANAFWNQGKEKAQKLYEERAAAVSARSILPNDGKPRWMQDRDVDMNGGWMSGFGDGNADVLPTASSSSSEQAAESQSTTSANTGNLLSEMPIAYVSPFRHNGFKPGNTSPSAPRTPSPVRPTQRQTIPASPTEIATSAKYKASGTEKYKLGQFGEAEAAYSTAIAALPASHLLLVPLYNNRALTRIKTGNQSGSVEDCTTVIELIGLSYNPTQEARVAGEEYGASVNLKDGLAKALKRRAEAWEGREKWDNARKDWEALAGIGWASATARNEAIRGAKRCKRMEYPDAVTLTESKLTSTLRPKNPLPPLGSMPPSQALSKLRAATNAQEAEDQAKHELKDMVDARLVAWKGGKETNIRALLASLDVLLWPELGWQKIGMAEVVTSSQVKVRYLKAIAKLHPDKLNTNNTTLEQRMIANGVFAALNKAWNTFKQ